MIEAKCMFCHRTEDLLWQIAPGFVIAPVCLNDSYKFALYHGYNRENSTFNTLEEAQVALIKRSL